MAETNPSKIKNEPSSRSDGSEDHKVSPMRSQGEDQTENNQSQVQQKTSKASTAETPPEGSCPSWFIKILEEPDESERQWSKMPKVPAKLNRANKGFYRPFLVSIGPYHHPYEDRKPASTDYEQLRNGEKLKAEMTRQFVKEIGKKKEDLCKLIEEVAKEARGFYDEDSVKSIEPEEFTTMMFVDGCFIVHFIYYVTRKYDDLKMSYLKIALVKRDLLLMENQLPFVFLDKLRSLRFGEDKEKNMFADFLRVGRTQKSSSVWARLVYYFLTFICCCCCCFCSRGQPLPTSPPKKKKDSHFICSTTIGDFSVNPAASLYINIDFHLWFYFLPLLL